MAGKVDKYQIYNGAHIRLNTFVKSGTYSSMYAGKKKQKTKNPVRILSRYTNFQCTYHTVHNFLCCVIFFSTPLSEVCLSFLCNFNWFMLRWNESIYWKFFSIADDENGGGGGGIWVCMCWKYVISFLVWYSKLEKRRKNDTIFVRAYEIRPVQFVLSSCA